MASGTSFDFSLPQLKPVHVIDDGRLDAGNLSSSCDVPSSINNQACLPRKSSGYAAPIPQSVMLGSLIEHLCMVYGNEPARANQLFKVICKQLENMKIISPVAYAEEYASVRFQYKKDLYRLIQSSFSTLPSEIPLGANKMAPRIPSARKFSPGAAFDFHGSRYMEEYEEISSLGKGAYGSVFKAKNKMDGQEYAVKKVRTKDANIMELPQMERIMREVQSLAALQHPNIVRYHCAWLEHRTVYEDDHSAETDSSGELPSGHDSVDSSDSRIDAEIKSLSWGEMSINTAVSLSDDMKKGKFWKVGSSEESSDDSSSDSSSASSEESGLEFEAKVHPLVIDGKLPDKTPEVICAHGVLRGKMRRVQSVILTSPRHFATTSSWSRLSRLRGQSYSNIQDVALLKPCIPSPTPCIDVPKEEMILYIQMQLCQTSLTKWLVDRNSAGTGDSSDPCSVVDEVTSLDIIQQVLQALDHVHSHNVMHRDVKAMHMLRKKLSNDGVEVPRNIFLNGSRPHVMLGDFGLARTALIKQHSMHESPMKDVSDFFTKEQTTGVGTMIYAAPEQINGDSYGFKADLYAAGIVLYELLWPLKTQHERVETIAQLRREEMSDQFARRWPNIVDTVKALLSHDIDTRPTARQLLDRNSLKVSNSVIFQQRKRIIELETEVARLRQQNEVYRSKLKENGVTVD